MATSPKEARPFGRVSLTPSYTYFEDDQVTYYYEGMPAGKYDFYFRLRASFEGTFVHPPARAELMYRAGVRGRSDGTKVLIRSNE